LVTTGTTEPNYFWKEFGADSVDEAIAACREIIQLARSQYGRVDLVSFGEVQEPTS